MAKKKKSRILYPEGTAPAIYTDWAFINKITGQAIAVFNPNGSAPSLRRTGIAVARAADLSFTKVAIMPVGMMSAEKIVSSNLAAAPRVTDPKGSTENPYIQAPVDAPSETPAAESDSAE